MLKDEEWGQWSDREIAKHCKVDHKTVGKIRKELTGEIPSDNQRNYKDRYGNSSVMKTENIGSDNKQELLTVEPGNDNKSKDKQKVLQIDCRDVPKTKTWELTPLYDEPLVNNFQVGQVVKIRTNAFRSDKRLVGYDTSFAVVTKLNTASADIKTWSGSFEAVSLNDLRIIDPHDVPLLCFHPSYNELQYLVANFDSREEIIKAAIAARSLNLPQ